MSRLFGLDFVRTAAIGIVVLSHSHQGLQPIGMYGVELFFALSGFLIGGILYRCVPERGSWTFSGVVNFWQRRWWRTLPNYYLFLLVAVVFYGPRGELPEGGWMGVLPYLFFVPNLMSPNEAFFDVSWSLCVEEAFYLLFPLFVLLFSRATGSRNLSFAASLAVFWIVPAVLREIAFASWPADQARIMTLPRLDAVSYGVAMAVGVEWWKERGTDKLRSRAVLALVGAVIVGGVVVGHFLSGSLLDAKAFYRVALVAMPAGFALFLPLLAEWRRLPDIAGAEWLRRGVLTISLWSYSIYLSHHIIILAVVACFENRESAAMKLMVKGIGLTLVLIVSGLVYRYYESRLTRLRPDEKHVAAAENNEPVVTTAG